MHLPQRILGQIAFIVLPLLGLFEAAGLGVRADTNLQILSPAFDPHGPIPTRYTCNGADVSPPLQWSGVSDSARSLALIVDDPDAPNQVWVHWVVYNLPPEQEGLEEDASGSLPEPAESGRNSWGDVGYGGPCPPSGTHRYRFKLYALDTRLEVASPDKTVLLQAMQGHVLEQAVLIGQYAQ